MRIANIRTTDAVGWLLVGIGYASSRWFVLLGGLALVVVALWFEYGDRLSKVLGFK